MNGWVPANSTRREFLKNTGRVAAAATMVSAAAPYVHAADDHTIHVALVGCGNRGTKAARNALSVQNGPIQLVAMADLFDDRLAGSHKTLSGEFAKQVVVPEDRRFVGFDAYQKAMDCLKPGDVVILATPPVFRWVHFPYAMKKDINVFMEKPVAVDGPTCVKMFKLGEESMNQNIKVAVGLMCRHCRARGELFERIKDGVIGDLTMLRAYRMAGQTGNTPKPPVPPGEDELMYQIKNFHCFLWASGGAYSDFLIHNIDECCWMKDAWPVKARSSGGRHFRGNNIDQNFDSYSTEFTFDDGAKLFLTGRTIPDCYAEHSSLAHGTKGSGIISESGHKPSKCRLFKNQSMSDANISWAWGKPEPDPYLTEWEDLVAAIREDKPYNEVKRGAEASLQCVMGRMAAHTGQEITREQALNCPHHFGPHVDKLTKGSPSPLRADSDGKYPVPNPGVLKDREYA